MAKETRGRKPKCIDIPKLAELMSLKPATIYRYLQGKSQCPVGYAKKLEEITKIHRLAWLYPDEYYNPYKAKIEGKHIRALARRNYEEYVRENEVLDEKQSS